MDQDKIKGQNVQVNIPVANNAPDNPYTTFYSSYIAKHTPDGQRVLSSKIRVLVATIFCGISNMLMFAYCIYMLAITEMVLTGYKDNTVSAENFATMALTLYAFFMIIALSFSIVAKVLNSKSKWAVVNFVLLAVLLAGALAVSFIVPGKAEDINNKRDGQITEELNDDIKHLMKKYSFDVMDLDENYSYHDGDEYDIWIYVSSEASKSQISKLDYFLEDLYEMDSSVEYQIKFTVHPVYFEPDDDSRFIFFKTYDFKYDNLSPRPERADIDDHIHVRDYSPRESGYVPENVEDGEMLIVIR